MWSTNYSFCRGAGVQDEEGKAGSKNGRQSRRFGKMIDSCHLLPFIHRPFLLQSNIPRDVMHIVTCLLSTASFIVGVAMDEGVGVREGQSRTHTSRYLQVTVE